MAHVITQACCKDAACVPVCPADCIRPAPGDADFTRAEMLFIDPKLCVDCGACITACPVDAIMPDDELPIPDRIFADFNAFYFDEGPGSVDRRRPTPEVPQEMGLAHLPSRPEVSVTAEPGLRVAIVGSGPSACYAAEQLLQERPDVRLTILERLATPWGLARAGVAPDHQDTKRVTELFERTVADPRVTFYLNVSVGGDIPHGDVHRHHDAVIYATGAPESRTLGIPGESLPGSHTAAEFVAWYNGHPDCADASFDLSTERAVIVGNGNVALDVARILLSGVDYLSRTDIADHALQALAESRVREVVVLGRRGPSQAAFTMSELVGLRHVPEIELVVDPLDANQDHGETLDAMARIKASMLAELQSTAPRLGRRVRLRFLRSPVEIVGTSRVQSLRVTRNELVIDTDGSVQAYSTGETEDLGCGLVFSSVGFHATASAGLFVDRRFGTIMNRAGRIIDPSTDRPMPGMYVVGWLKRGATGVIGTNKHDTAETVAALMEDAAGVRLVHGAPARRPDDASRFADVLAKCAPDAITWEQARSIDEHERRQGAASGRPRVKVVRASEMLALAKGD